MIGIGDVHLAGVPYILLMLFMAAGAYIGWRWIVQDTQSRIKKAIEREKLSRVQIRAMLTGQTSLSLGIKALAFYFKMAFSAGMLFLGVGYVAATIYNAAEFAQRHPELFQQ